MHNRETSGSILIVVLLLAAICLTIGTGLTFLYRINNRLARNYLFETQALYLAEAGLSKAETILRKNPTYRVPVAGDLDIGTYEIEFLVDQEQLQQQKLTLPVQAVGYVGSARQTLVEHFILEPYPQHEAYDYALVHGAKETELILSENSHIIGHIFSNGDVIVLPEVIVEGTIYTSSAVWCEQEKDLDAVAGISPIAIPECDLDFYRLIADKKITGPTYIGSTAGEEKVIFVSGDAVLTGDISPGTVIIVSGQLTVADTFSSSDTVLLIGLQGIEVYSNSMAVVLYSPSCISFQTPATIAGSVIGQKIISSAGICLSYQDPVKQTLHAPLPGFTVTRSTWHQRVFLPVIN